MNIHCANKIQTHSAHIKLKKIISDFNTLKRIGPDVLQSQLKFTTFSRSGN